MDNEHNIQTVIAPVGLGGKTNPYVADPAPTLLVELASVETDREEARIAALLAAAEQSAAKLVAEAAAAAAETLRIAEQDAESITSQAMSRQAELDERSTELDAKAMLLDERGSQLDELEARLNDRTAAVDAEAAEAASILATARIDAETILAEAHSSAEQVLAEANEQARIEAESTIVEARASESADDAAEARIAEFESIHRIELQVLHERETELLARIGHLESQLGAARRKEADPEPAREVAATTDTVSVEIDSLTPLPEEPRSNGRHNGDVRVAEYAGSSPLTTHAPLTEQLSTSAFRTTAEADRRGRRRR
jgi:hypothetical protein